MQVIERVGGGYLIIDGENTLVVPSEKDAEIVMMIIEQLKKQS